MDITQQSTAVPGKQMTAQVTALREIQRNPWVEEKELRVWGGKECIEQSTREARATQKSLESAEDPPQVLAEHTCVKEVPKEKYHKKELQGTLPKPHTGLGIMLCQNGTHNSQGTE